MDPHRYCSTQTIHIVTISYKLECNLIQWIITTMVCIAQMQTHFRCSAGWWQPQLFSESEQTNKQWFILTQQWKYLLLRNCCCGKLAQPVCWEKRVKTIVKQLKYGCSHRRQLRVIRDTNTITSMWVSSFSWLITSQRRLYLEAKEAHVSGLKKTNY